MPAGETNASPSPWKIDSLHQHLVEKLEDAREASLVRFTAQEQAIAAALVAQARLLDEIDRRYEQRFTAQENAVGLALARVDKEFHEHLQQVRDETHAALQAADKAIQKAEAATEKRFEGVNEFRAQLADQARTFISRTESISRHERTGEQMDGLVQLIAEMRDRFQTQVSTLMPRSEAEQRIAQNTEKITALEQRHGTDISQVNSRLDIAAGRGAGLDKGWGYLIALIGVVGGVIGVVIALTQ